ncbi:MAG: MBL fold metallo-hydrolase [Gammaproteobacteria bacterium]
MKLLHKPYLYCWSQFNEERDIDFHSYLWVREKGNIVIDPLPQCAHDQSQLLSLGRVTHILVSNSDHIRNSEYLSRVTGAEIWGPEAENATFPVRCQHWLGEGDEVVEGLTAYAMEGSKTPGELAFLLGGDTLITGDLIRSHAGGSLCLLPDAKLTDKPKAMASVRRLAGFKEIDAVLPGDGWPVFRGGLKALSDLVAAFPQ